jgi:phosphoribosyl-dephospho-CoA transferase
MLPDPVQPHDLLWIAGAAGVRADGPLPAWATDEWLRRAPLVVRREHCDAGAALPVGLRGATRSERCKAYLERGALLRRVTPEALAADAGWRRLPAGRCAALEALAALAPQLDASGLAWGPTGGVGFALASGLPVLRPDSDLDLLVRAPQPLDGAERAALLALGRYDACRIDLQIDTGHGAFALAEWAAGGRVLLKTNHGPLLCDDPWQARSAP